MQGASGLTLVQYLHQLDNQTRTVVLTGYASIATAVEAIKLGATHYLAKPANADEIIAAFGRTQGATDLALNEQPLSVDRLEWEHIQRIYKKMTAIFRQQHACFKYAPPNLQRKLAKYPVKI
jgi:two-component system response regulator RegA